MEDRLALLKSIIANILEGILIVDNEGEILLVNTAACRMFGYTKNELHGEKIHLLMPAFQLQVVNSEVGVNAITKMGNIFNARFLVSESIFNREIVYAVIIQM